MCIVQKANMYIVHLCPVAWIMYIYIIKRVHVLKVIDAKIAKDKKTYQNWTVPVAPIIPNIAKGHVCRYHLQFLLVLYYM